MSHRPDTTTTIAPPRAIVQMSHVWHKLAALAGSSAVGAAAYGAHILPSQASDPYFESVFERSNQMH
jgi:hypothetical protein